MSKVTVKEFYAVVGGNQNIVGFDISMVTMPFLQVFETVSQLIQQSTDLPLSKRPALVRPPLDLLLQVILEILEIHAQPGGVPTQRLLLLDFIRAYCTEITMRHSCTLNYQSHHLFKLCFSGNWYGCHSHLLTIVVFDLEGASIALVEELLPQGIVRLGWRGVAHSTISKQVVEFKYHKIVVMSLNNQYQKGRQLASLRIHSFVQLPALTPLDKQLSSVLFQAHELRSRLNYLSDIPGMLNSLKQELTNQIIGLCMNFEMIKNDMKYRCDNLQATVVNMQEIKQMDRVRYAETLASRDAQIAELAKRLEYMERHQTIKDKTEVLTQMRNSAEEKEVVTLNQRITDLLNVIQTSNNEIHDLKSRLRHNNQQPTSYQQPNHSSNQQIRSLQLKNALVSKELEEYKLENCQLAQQIKYLKFGEQRQKSSSKGKLVPRLDISLNWLDEGSKTLNKSINKVPLMRLKKSSTNNKSSKDIKESFCELTLKPSNQTRSRVQTLNPPGNFNSSKVKIRKFIDNIENTSYHSHLRSLCEAQDRFDKLDKTTAAATDRDFVEKISLKGRPVFVKTEVDSFLSSLRKTTNR